ncbi:MAG: AmmeMemoRadiSam system protein B [Phycisphaerae bacterium]|nr:AmmeMemoRadiSam system protein B [Phycisphaerae bacterium]
MADYQDKPRLRPVEAIPTEHEGRRMIALHDPAGFAHGLLTITEPVLLLLTHFDGEHTLEDVRGAFARQTGQDVLLEQLQDLVRQLDEALFLEGPTFEAHVERIEAAFREMPARFTQPDSGLGVELHQLPMALKEILEGGKPAVPAGRVVGLIAPHLDLRRGANCYADAYGVLGRAGWADRYVVLGTNHFGRCGSVVATTKEFATPLGRTPSDADLIQRLNRDCGVDLCEHEYDHAREHSVELQVLFLQQAFYRQPFRIVPVLCPDPCGPTGTQPYDGQGVDLRVFAEALGDALRDDGTPTCIIAGADLSHVGRRFGDDADLADGFLQSVEAHDRAALKAVEANDPEAFRTSLAESGNPTRICSAGSIYTLMTTLRRAYDPARLSAHLLRYEQAADGPEDTCVTCAAVAFTLNE